jgi:hypothetical protein
MLALIALNQGAPLDGGADMPPAGGGMQKFIVELLSRTAILSAYPLARLAIPDLDLAGWRRFARLALDGRRGAFAGILVARRAARGHVCGLVCFRREPDLIFGQILQARNLIAADILDVQGIFIALINRLGALAQDNGCASLHLMIPEGDGLVSQLPGITAGLERRSVMHHWNDVTIATNLTDSARHRFGGDKAAAVRHNIVQFCQR